jgi:hypothetical protein
MLPEEPKLCPLCFGRDKLYKHLFTQELTNTKEMQRIGVYTKYYKPKGIIIEHFYIIDCTCKTKASGES